MSTDLPPDHAKKPVPHTLHPLRPVRTFVLRGGRMGTGQVRALTELWPLYGVPFQPGGGFDWDACFGRQAPRVLEIGFGMGQATAEIAAARPDLDFICCEVHEAGVGALLRNIGERGLRNLRIVRHDALEVLRQMVAPASLAGMHVYFPDPWHKKRHHKRRLIQAPTVDLMATRLAPGGWLHCATDWQPYAEQMLQVLGDCALLANTCAGYAPRPTMRPLTRFEARGLRLGHGVWDLLFERPRAAPPTLPTPPG